MGPIFAVGDIHGQSDELERVLSLVEADRDSDAPVVFLGDYVDRGPDSSRVLERLIAGQEEGRPWIALAGNHDISLTEFLDPHGMSDDGASGWLGANTGGAETLSSYGIDTSNRPVAEIRADARETIPARHQAWLNALPRIHETAAHIFVHAGIRPSIPLDAQDGWELVTIREGFLDDDSDHGRLVVHGHTAAEGPYHAGNRVNLDGGAGLGAPLCAAVLTGRDVSLLTDRGRVPFLPGSTPVLPSH
ncbi:hypothetical protein OCH239_06385 [Roseivivax halodurans JCM 10272]|uniref:Calcineurin-like phosphoesterase domain-containing protein n=2 Tax=Roseivivax halodurans TaxID=93683 RepID=X7EF25_9RHOB|nr:hypothetical protein OCH239_06385 [Roseivivax halodurans JCM 10272]